MVVWDIFGSEQNLSNCVKEFRMIKQKLVDISVSCWDVTITGEELSDTYTMLKNTVDVVYMVHVITCCPLQWNGLGQCFILKQRDIYWYWLSLLKYWNRKYIHKVYFLPVDYMIYFKPYALQNSRCNRTRTCDLPQINFISKLHSRSTIVVTIKRLKMRGTIFNNHPACG